MVKTILDLREKYHQIADFSEIGQIIPFLGVKDDQSFHALVLKMINHSMPWC